MRKVRTLASLSTLLAVAFPTAAHSATETTLYFHSPTAVGNVDQVGRAGAVLDGPSMNATAPSKSTPSIGGEGPVQSTAPKNGPYAPVWSGAFSGHVTGPADVVFWASAAPSTKMTVSLFADEGSTTPVARAKRSITSGASPAPTKYAVHFDNLEFDVQREVMVQIAVPNAAAVYYDSTEYPSSFTFSADPLTSPTPAATTFQSYPAPDSIFGAHGPNETSLGVDPRTNAAMFLMSTSTARVTWDDSVTPAIARWNDVSYLETSVATLDPYLWTDRATGRTYVLQLAGSHSLAAFTDDDGANWTPANPPSSAPSIDHESLVGGPYAAGAIAPTNPYGRALYYCSQGEAASVGTSAGEVPVLAVGQCARSDNGGLSWNPPVPFTAYQDCLPSHGRITVDATGVLYVPVKGCGPSGQGMFISRDSGVTFEQVIVPGLQAGKSDPALAIDGANRLYYAAASNGTVKVATTTDGGRTFAAPVDVGAALGIRNAEFAMAVGGDAGRAAVAFYGSTTAGDDQNAGYTGEWHVYVATTLDGGATWTTVDATGSDPVQRGYICMGGFGCAAGRNLLDFQSITIDNAGRILVGYADGCTSAKCIAAAGKNNEQAESTDSLGTIARQVDGPRLLASATP